MNHSIGKVIAWNLKWLTKKIYNEV